MKIIAVILYLISLFLFQNLAGYAVVTVFLGVVIVYSHVPLGYITKGLKPILFLLLFTACFHVFFTQAGDVLFQWKFISITSGGIKRGAFMALRLTYLVIGSSLLTYTTTPNKLTDAIEALLKPLEKIKVPLRFIPILLEEANRIIRAQSARGADFEEGKLIERLKGMVSILVPLLVSATKRAYDLALAMEARCYRGGEGRTKMKPPKYRKADGFAMGIVVLYIIILLIVRHFL